MKAKILIVDDEPEQIKAFAQILRQEEYKIAIAEDDLEALYSFDEFRPNLIILDIRFGLDERMGIDILKKVRERDKMIPIIMLTGLDDEGLDSLSYNRDADHFVSKSVSTKSLLDLVRRCLRRSKPEVVLIDDRIEINLSTMTAKAKRDSKWHKIHFQPKEFRILVKLVSNQGRVVTRETLYDEFFSDVEDPAATLNRHISRLRKELELEPHKPQYILTKRGIGYLFRDCR
jgi:DNA-binding response OmpR family regulator